MFPGQEMQFETKYHPQEYRGGEPSTSQDVDADSAAPNETTDIVSRIAEAQKLALAAESDLAIDGPSGRHATPLPNRPKGRLFIGFVLCAILGFLVYVVWSTWFAFHAYGEVQGDIIHVCSVAQGMLEGVHVRAGDRVRQGQLLATVTDYEMLREIDRLTNGLLTVRANIELTQAELAAAKVRWSSNVSTERAEFYEASAALAIEVAKLTEMQLNVERMKAVRERSENAISDQELLTLELTAKGQAVRVEQLQLALEEQKKAVEKFGGVEEADRLQPILTELEIVKHKLEALVNRSRKVRSPRPPTAACSRYSNMWGSWPTGAAS